MDYPPCLQENLDPPSMIFQKSNSPINKGGGSHYDNNFPNKTLPLGLN